MKRIKNFFRNYFQSSSWFKILSDFIFYLLLILMLIPSSRVLISEKVIRATMFNPRIKTENVKILSRNDFEMDIADRNGNIRSLKEFKGQVIMINFWATWCPPCRAEMPSLQKLYDDYSDKMVFLFIANDEKLKVDRFMSDNSYNLPVYFQSSAVPDIFNIEAIPTTFVIDRNGGIIVNKKGAADWNSAEFRNKLNSLINSE